MVNNPKGNPRYTSIYIRDSDTVRKDGELVLFEDAVQSHLANSSRWLVSKNLTDLLGSRLGDGGFIPKGVDSRPELEKLGFKVIGESGDPLFYDVEPPRGWTKSTNGYHTYIKDGQGRVRAYQFFKGAIYEYRANLEIKPASVTLVGRVKVTDKNFLKEYNKLQDTLNSEFGVPPVDVLGKIASEMTAERYRSMLEAIVSHFRYGTSDYRSGPLEPVCYLSLDYLKKMKSGELNQLMAIPGILGAFNSCRPPTPVQDEAISREVEDIFTPKRNIIQEALRDKSVPHDEKWLAELRSKLPKGTVIGLIHLDLSGVPITAPAQKIDPITEFNEQRALLENVIEQEIGKIIMPFEDEPNGIWYQLPSGVTLATHVYQPVKVQITDGVGKVIGSGLNHPEDKITLDITANGKRPLEEQLSEFDRVVMLARDLPGFSQK